MNRRRFLQGSAAAAAFAGKLVHAAVSEQAAWPVDGVALPDDGWSLWIDHTAAWEEDEIFLPAEVDLGQLPVNPPNGGWKSLYARQGGEDFATVTLPTTVEEHFWGKYGSRSYTPEEYRYAADDPVPQNGAYRGVSWWWRAIGIPESMRGKRILLHLRGARMRAEVYLNEQLCGYSIMEELPFDCDLTAAARPGGTNRLAIRITNPGGRYDWVDGTTIRWGKVNLYRSHGFGGIDRELTLRAVPQAAHLVDVWVLNTPEPRTVKAFADYVGEGRVTFEVMDPVSGKVVSRPTGEAEAGGDGSRYHAGETLHCAEAHLWDLDSPTLYRLRATLTANGEGDVRHVEFGFRWFAPEGLGTNAVFRLNGRRIKLFSAISWGYWGQNGLWPTPELAEREVKQAQALGLNCLNFHRNVGKEEVLRQHDRLGLLRYMEPGGGKLSIGKLPSGVAPSAPDIVMQKAADPADEFSQRFMLAKCAAMVRAFRSHPSLIQYTLQNELGADLKNPGTFTAIDAMHAEDPSRSVVLNDGFSPPPRSAPQAWYAPWNSKMYRSDEEPWAEWWNNHQGAGDQWYDNFYQDADRFTYRQPLLPALVEFGEMEGCAVADNHALMVRQLSTRQFDGSGSSYDLTDHREILDAYNRFLDRWGFRSAFPTAEALFRSMGAKCYESWHQYLENVRICDAVDFAVVSGWESTAIENHSGIVDNLRNWKGDPALLASSLRPLRLVAKQHRLCSAVGESTLFDLYLLNETGRAVTGKLRFSMVDPGGGVKELAAWDAPANVTDQFSYRIQTEFRTPPLTVQGTYRFRFASDAQPEADFEREILVADTRPGFSRKVTVGVSGELASVRQQLGDLPDVEVAEFSQDAHYDLIVASGVVPGSTLDHAIGEETGLEVRPPKGAPTEAQPPGHIPATVLSAVRAGTPLLAVVPDDFLADGVARQLAGLGLFTYAGQVGDLRAPWMGNWLFVREHPTFADLPVNCTMGVHYQAHGKPSNGLLIDRAAGAEDPEVILAYSRDHDRKIGAASFVCQRDRMRVLVHRAPRFSLPLQQRWLANVIAYLTEIEKEKK